MSGAGDFGAPQTETCGPSTPTRVESGNGRKSVTSFDYIVKRTLGRGRKKNPCEPVQILCELFWYSSLASCRAAY